MGKNVSKKKIDYGAMAGEAITTNEKEPTPTVTPTQTRTVTHTPTYTPAHSRAAKVREPKSERLQMVVRPSTKTRLSKYAEDHDTSISEVVQRLIDDLLDNAGY